jgi:hypothetical protein
MQWQFRSAEGCRNGHGRNSYGRNSYVRHSYGRNSHARAGPVCPNRCDVSRWILDRRVVGSGRQ